MNTLVAMSKHEAYKDSGVEWLDDIPSSWNVKPGMVAFTENKRNNKGMKEDKVLSLSYGEIVVKPPEKLTGLVPESFETYQLVEPGDIIVRCMDLQNDKESLRFGLAKNNGIITSAYLNLKVKKGFNSKYLFYYFHSLDITKVIYRFGSGLRQNLSFLDFRRLPIFEISEEEQTAIANFLDRKTTKIDQAIAIKEKQIALLKERKQILIQNAITRGLDPDVPMKDSGVEWIGEIPEHWVLRPIKYLKKNIKNAFVDGPFGSNLKSEHYIEGGDAYVVESGFITTGVFLNKTFKTISLKHFKSISRSECKGSDVIIAKIGANFGMAAELPDLNKPAVVSGNSLKITLENKNILNQVFVKLLGVAKYSGGFEDIVNASAQPALSLGGLNNMRLPIGTLKEQKEIVEYIEMESGKVDRAISLQKQQIEKFKEYKSTLINSAVTGKIKVV